MAQATSELKAIISRYVRELYRQNVRPEQVIVFGSHARGEATPDSDIDRSIISSDVAGKGILERQLLLGRANQDLQAPMDVVGYTPAEVLACVHGTLLYEIHQTGISIPIAELMP